MDVFLETSSAATFGIKKAYCAVLGSGLEQHFCASRNIGVGNARVSRFSISINRSFRVGYPAASQPFAGA